MKLKLSTWITIAIAAIIIAVCMLALFRNVEYVESYFVIAIIIATVIAFMTSWIIYNLSYKGWGQLNIIPKIDELRNDFFVAKLITFLLLALLFATFVLLTIHLIKSDDKIIDLLASAFMIIAVIWLAICGHKDTEAIKEIFMNRDKGNYNRLQYIKAEYRQKGIDDGKAGAEFEKCTKTNKFYTATMQEDINRYKEEYNLIWGVAQTELLEKNKKIEEHHSNAEKILNVIRTNVNALKDEIERFKRSGNINQEKAKISEKLAKIEKANQEIKDYNDHGRSVYLQAKADLDIFNNKANKLFSDYRNNLTIYWRYLLDNHHEAEGKNRQLASEDELLIMFNINIEHKHFVVKEFIETNDFKES